MKKSIRILITLIIFISSQMNLSAQLIPAADNSSYYYIQFRHNASINAVMEDMGSGNVMKAQTRTLGKDAQLWRVTAGVTQGSYVFTSKLGNKIVWDNGTSRYKTSSTGTGADIKLLYSNNATYTKSFELQRAESTQAFNVWGGVAINNEIAEYGVGDAGGTVIFVRAPEISSIDDSAERWYWFKNYRGNGRVVDTNGAAPSFNITTPNSFRKFKVVKHATNTTYGIVYNDGSNKYIQQLTADDSNPNPITNIFGTEFLGFEPFSPTVTTATADGSAAGIPGWRINRTSASTGFLHVKSGGVGLRYYNVKEDANVWNFFDARDVLGENYAEVFAFYNQTTEGNNPGEYSTSARAALKTVLDASLALYNNPAALESELLTQSTNLTTAFNIYKAAVNLIKASDGTNTYWYQIRDKRSAVYWNIATVGTTANALNRTTTSNPTANTQLFKFVQAPNPAIGYYIYSKTNETTALSAPATTDGSIISIDAAQTATSWKFETASPGYFLVMTETGSRQLNSYADKISYYNGGAADDGNNWMFIELDLTVLKNTYTQKRTEARDLYTATTTLEGTDFGQYSAASRSTLDAIVSAEENKDVETLSFNQLEANIITLQSAIDGFKNSVNNNLNSLLSSNSDNNRWYRIKNKNYPTKVITANTVVENGTVICEDGGTSTDAELWRFELNQAGTTVKIISKSQPTLGIQENGQSNNAKLISFVNASEFVIGQQGVYLTFQKSGGGTHNFLHCAGHFTIVGWAAGADASQWTVEYVSETVKPERTLTVTTANAAHGSAVITGTALTTSTSRQLISVTATPAANHLFVNWTNAVGVAEVSTENPYIYVGEGDIGLVANFEEYAYGTMVTPVVSTVDNPVYYYIYSASDGSQAFNGSTVDARSKVIISPDSEGKLINNNLGTATSNAHALWAIVDIEGTTYLKNKATGFFMKDAFDARPTGEAFSFAPVIAGDNQSQFKIGTSDYAGHTIAWRDNLCDKLPSNYLALNGLSAWYFVSPNASGDVDLSVAANWTNGVMPDPEMSVVVNGNATASGDLSFSGMTINSGKSLTVAPGKKLTIGSSFVNDGTITLQSDATGTATLLTPETITGAGDATVEQYLPAAATRTWWYLASPVSGADYTVFGSNSVGEYDETTTSYSENPFSTPTELTAGKGYVVKMNATEAATAKAYSFAGALNTGNVTVNLTRTGNTAAKRGFNLVGNPYPSYLNWEMAYNASTNVRSTIWYRTKGTSAMEFHTYNAALGVSVPTAASGYIPPMQAFWVKVDTDPVSPATVSNGTLNFTNAMRGHAIQGTTTPLKAPATNSLPLLRIALSNGSTSDETVIALHENASANFDQYDSEKMSNTGTSEVFTLAGTQELTINAQPDSEGSKLIPLGIRPANAGSLNLSVSELKNLDNMQIILHDNVLKTETQLSLNQSYHFTTVGTATNNRFSIEFRAPGMTTGLDNSDFADFNITVYSGKIQIQSPAMANGELIRVYSSNGQKIIEQTAEGNSTIIDHKLSSGVYFVKVSNYVQKIIIH